MSPIVVMVISIVLCLCSAVLFGIVAHLLRSERVTPCKLYPAVAIVLIICSAIICGNSVRDYVVSLQPQVQTIKVNGTELEFDSSEEIKISIDTYGQLHTVTWVRINEDRYEINDNGKLRPFEQPVPTDPPRDNP